MRTFTCPAKYRRFVEAQLALAIAEVGRDIARRRQDEHIVRAYDSLASKRATIPEQFIDAEKGGDLLILVGEPNADAEADPDMEDSKIARGVRALMDIVG